MGVVHARRRVSPVVVAPSTEWEQGWWAEGYAAVCGVDEVGRGALAGPLVAAAVQLRHGADHGRLGGVADSKTLDRACRERLADIVLDAAEAVGVGEVSAAEIDEIGLGPANRLVMLRAVTAIGREPDVLLVDAMTINLDRPQVGLIDGDARCLSIAAASIVAKVHRDRLMARVAEEHRAYGFERHVGYGTAQHLRALSDHGPCVEHRRSFAPVRRRLER